MPSDFEIAIGRLTNLANNPKTPKAVSGDLALVLASARNSEQVRAEGENAGLEKARHGILGRIEYFKSIEEDAAVYTCTTLLEDLDERIRAAKLPVAQGGEKS